MKIIAILPPAGLPAAEDFSMNDSPVQGARTGRRGNARLVDSPRRFKLFSEGNNVVCFLRGSGHFKWQRGETPFAAGDAFRIEGEGEYEVNGPCAFIVVRE